MSFTIIKNRIKDAIKKTTANTVEFKNTLVGKIENENIVEIDGESYRKIKLRIVEKTNPETEEQI